MGTPQPGIFTMGTRAHRHLEFDLRVGVSDDAFDVETMRAAIRSVRELGPEDDSLNTVIAFGSLAWSALSRLDVPEDLADFPRIDGVPRTQHDLWVWIHGDDPGHIFDHARHVSAALAGAFRLERDTQGFVYLDNRDLLGFIDGTENPDPEEAPEVVCLPDGVAGEGGTHAIVQRWVHRIDAFEELPVTEQELVIGRTKSDSTEIADEVRPTSAHISRVVITDPSDDEDGEELEIFRRSIPYGDVEENGLQFVGFAPEPTRIERMMRRMFGQGTEGRSDDAVRDRITEFSTPVSGSFYFAPSLEALQAAAAPAPASS
ncbi:MAG: Dyp-type peroxidase [Acidimicrobiales bacterium]